MTYCLINSRNYCVRYIRRRNRLRSDRDDRGDAQAHIRQLWGRSDSHQHRRRCDHVLFRRHDRVPRLRGHIRGRDVGVGRIRGCGGEGRGARRRGRLSRRGPPENWAAVINKYF